MSVLTLLGSVALASWARPPAVVFGSSANEAYSFKRDNQTGSISVSQKDIPDTVLWQCTLTGASGLFSKVLLSDDGQFLIHIRGNHQVNAVEDMVIEVIKKDGSRATLLASDFIDALGPPLSPRMSNSPRHMWIRTFDKMSTSEFTLTNANGEQKVIQLKDLTFVAAKP